jgi:hypothetical protein
VSDPFTIVPSGSGGNNGNIELDYSIFRDMLNRAENLKTVLERSGTKFGKQLSKAYSDLDNHMCFVATTHFGSDAAVAGFQWKAVTVTILCFAIGIIAAIKFKLIA